VSRYLFKFEKTGQLRYISHLDLLRLFRRTFKRLGVELVYSQGFNPHPKMSFAQPLSLGYTSESEYLEFETRIPYNEDFLVASMNSALPYGIEVLDCRTVPDSVKTAASRVRWASYEVRLPEGRQLPTESQLREFLNQDKILITKPIKKGKDYKQIDIRPMIGQLKLNVNDEGDRVLFMKIHAGSESNLNPELLLNPLFEFAGIPLEKYEPQVKRLELYGQNGQPLYADLQKA
jgi:radical SAM-linked protein